MTTFINELLQDILVSSEDYTSLAENIYNIIIKNDESMYNHIIDAIQILILQQTDKFLLFNDCEDLYLAIKGFESIYEEGDML